MLKKRIVFTLLYDSGFFMLSRNFRLQKVGDLRWLKMNYDFSHIAFYIDELVVLDVTRGERKPTQFCEDLRELAQGCFVPIAAGGGIRTVDQARSLLRSGADKIVINTPLFEPRAFVKELIQEFGQQCVVASVDVSKSILTNDYDVFTKSGSVKVGRPIGQVLEDIVHQNVGEIYLNSIDRDGTGQGYDLVLLDYLPAHCPMPIIFAGGVGNKEHLKVGFADPRIDAVATANLFNFVGNGLQKAREALVDEGASLAIWPDIALLGVGKTADV
jgi:imidazole glycerol-phosphate synthase subunit HisF